MLSFFIFIKLTLPSAVPSRVQGALRFHRPRLPRLQTRCRQELHHQSNPSSPPGRWPPSAEPPVHLQLLWSAYRSECIRRSIKRICTVQQRFHLPAHLVIINWRYKHNDIGAPHIFRQRERIVLSHAMMEILTGQTSFNKRQLTFRAGFLSAQYALRVWRLPQTHRQALRNCSDSENLWKESESFWTF